MDARDFREPDDLRALQELAVDVWRAAGVADHPPGTLAWAMRQHVGREPEWRRRLWLDGGDVVAWGWVTLPGDLVWQVAPAHPELLDDVLAWFEREAEGDELETTAVAGAGWAQDVLAARGFAPDPDAPFSSLMTRPLDELEPSTAPPGYELRTVRGEEDVAARVAVHRAAFHPSRVTEESYRNVMRTPPYRPDLDCVAVAPDGELASYVLAWLDPELALGEFEPVGTDPRHRRRGLARATSLDALARLRAAGAREAFVACRGDTAYPVPKLLYESVGFRERDRTIPFRKRCASGS